MSSPPSTAHEDDGVVEETLSPEFDTSLDTVGRAQPVLDDDIISRLCQHTAEGRQQGAAKQRRSKKALLKLFR